MVSNTTPVVDSFQHASSAADCILTVTANPSLDHTIELTSELKRSQVQRYSASRIDAAGKGVNVSKAILAAGMETIAFFPAPDRDVYTDELRRSVPELRCVTIPTDAAVRTNITIAEGDGTTTKLNSLGNALKVKSREELTRQVISYANQSARNISWIVLAGSLPLGVEPEFYVHFVTALKKALAPRCPHIAVDTSGAALAAFFKSSAKCRPTLIKPNGLELAELLDYRDLAAAEENFEKNPLEAAKAAMGLMERNQYELSSLLLTLGAHGAVFVSYGQGKTHAWYASNEPVQAKSTVGAGDSSLAGLLIAHARKARPEECLKNAVAYGTAAACLPGTSPPLPQNLNYDAIHAEKLF